MKMTPYLSDKIKVLSFICILMVIYIHMYYMEGEGMVCFSFLSSLIGDGFCRVAVPLFYAISGYLFFLNAEDISSVIRKMKKRVNTLLVPYLLVNVLTFVFYVVLGFITLYSTALKKVVNIDVLDNLNQGILSVVKLIFLNPIAFQLWFVRDLMIVILFAPILFYILHKGAKSKIGLILLVLCAVLLLCFGIGALLWFSLGGIFCILPSVRVYSWYHNWGITILFVCLYIAMCFAHALQLIPYFTGLIPLVGIPAVWLIYDKIVNGRILCTYPFVSLLCSYTFFLYLIHEPMLNIFKKIPLLFDRSEETIVLCYLIVPVLFTIIAIKVGKIFKLYFPEIYFVYTGGR